MIRLVLRPFLWTPLLLAISQLSICEAADHLWLDIDDTAQQTALLHLSLNPSSGSSASTNAGTLLTISGSPNFEFYSHTDLLLTDGAANSGPGASITLTLANLPAGTWTVESWHHQGDSVSGSIQIDFGPQGGSTTTLVNQEPFSTSGVSYQITTDGTSTYELHFTEDDANDRTCLNGLHIRPSSAGAFPPVLLTDVSPSNTTALGGSPSPFSSTSPTTGNLWRQRNGFGFDELGNGEVYEKDANGGNGNATILETTITGLTPNTDYGIYSAFLSVPNESWRIRMGLTSTEFTEFTPSSPAGRVLNLGITGVAGSNRHQYLGYLTNTTSNASGEITVFFDDGEGTTANSRTWLEGAAVGEPFFPPPPPPLPGGAVEVAPDGVWTWFNDERAIFHQGYLYSGYVRSDGHVGLTRYNPATETSQHMTLSTSRAQEVDDHNNPSITVLPDDRLLVTYAKHNSAAEFYYRTSITTTPSSDSDWNAQQIRSTTNGSTYSNTYRLSSESDTIYNFSRSINFNPTLTTSTDNGASYNTPQHFISTGGGGTRPYPRYVSNDDDRIDLIYTDGHPRNNNNSIYHLHYHQNNFRLSDGTILKNISNLPIDHDANERGTVIYTYSSAPWAAGEGPDDYIPDARAWTWDIHYGSGGHPVCVFQAQVNNVTGGSWQDDRIYYYYARWTGTAWEKHFIAQAGRGIYSNERDYGGGMRTRVSSTSPQTQTHPSTLALSVPSRSTLPNATRSTADLPMMTGRLSVGKLSLRTPAWITCAQSFQKTTTDPRLSFGSTAPTPPTKTTTPES